MTPNSFIPHIPTAHSIIYALDIFGIIVCTIAATVLAKRLQFDILGGIFISFIGSVGGGTLRDLLLNRHPIFWLHDFTYIYVIVSVSIIVHIFYHYVEKLDKAMRWFDALGLATFSVIGIEASISSGMQAPIIILMGVFTAILGGVMRDIVCCQIPLVLQKEIYITASVIGSSYYLIMAKSPLNPWFNTTSTILLIFTIRMLAIYRNWNLPSITIQPKSTQTTQNNEKNTP